MAHMRRLATVVFFAGVFSLACGGARADEGSNGNTSAFEKGLAKVQSLYKRGKGKDGVKSLQSLLLAHEGQGYVRARRAEIEDLARRMAFQAHVKQPDPKELVSGRLMKWKPSTGQIKIQYTIKTRKDLIKSDKSQFYWFPARVAGPFSLDVKGTHYPRKTDDSPRMIFGGDKSESGNEDQSWQVTFGIPPYNEGQNQVWMPAIITYYDGDNETEISKKDITPARAGKSYKLTLKVTKTSIMPSVNGKPIGKAKKPKEIWGRVGFEVPGWREITFSGKIEPSYIQSKIDEVVQEQRAEFDKTYDRSKILPAWLFEAAKTTPADEATPQDDLPEQLDRKHWKDLEHIYEALDHEDYKAGLEAVAGMKARGAPASVCAFLAASLYRKAGELKRALAEISRCTELAPGFLMGWVLKGTLLRRLGRDKEAAAAFREGIKRHPKDAMGYEMAALWMLYAGDTASAREFAQEAARKGLVSKRLDLLNGALVKAVRGPTWSRVFGHKSRNYHVLSDIDKNTCLEASKVLEEAFTAYRVNFGWVSRDKTQLFKVYLFSGRAGFMSYQKDLAGIMGRSSERAAGLYSPLLKQLLIWNLPSRDAMIETIRHEGFHQYLDRFMPDPPTWFNEGLAVYHEYVDRKSGKLVYGKTLPEYVELLREKGLVPLKEFLFQPHRQFYVNGHRSYGQAWAFLHMLRHGKREYRDIFKQLVRDLQTDEAAVEVLRRVFSDILLMKLDKDLAAYVAILN